MACWIEDSWCPCLPSVYRSNDACVSVERTLRGCNSEQERRRGRTRTLAGCSEVGDAPAIAALERTTTRYGGRSAVLPIFGVASCRGLAGPEARTNLGDAPEQPSSRADSVSRSVPAFTSPLGKRGVRHKTSRVEASRETYHVGAPFGRQMTDNRWRDRVGFGSWAKPDRTISSLRPQPFLLASRPGAGPPRATSSRASAARRNGVVKVMKRACGVTTTREDRGACPSTGLSAPSHVEGAGRPTS
jgi:hypothetical protein